MNHLLTRSVLRSLVTGVNSGRCVSSPVASRGRAVVAVVTPFEDASVARVQDFGILSQWRRSLSAVPEPKAPEKEEEKKKPSEGGEAALNEEKHALPAVSSYWGISKRKILREDGTEWPWNCFMVSYTHVNLHMPMCFINTASNFNRIFTLVVFDFYFFYSLFVVFVVLFCVFTLLDSSSFENILSRLSL